jgi:hypothetical protein
MLLPLSVISIVIIIKVVISKAGSAISNGKEPRSVWAEFSSLS